MSGQRSESIKKKKNSNCYREYFFSKNSKNWKSEYRLCKLVACSVTSESDKQQVVANNRDILPLLALLLTWAVDVDGNIAREISWEYHNSVKSSQ